MPQNKIDYSKTIIYKLCCKDITITDIYVGHTTDMRRRKSQHKTTCNNEKAKIYSYNVYKFIRENGGWDNWDMIEVERFEAIDGNDARKKERYWIEELKATLNNRVPSRTAKEWCEDNKEYYKNNIKVLLEYKKKYYENNTEKILEKVKCECGCVVCRTHLNRHLKTKKHINLMLQPMRSSTITRQSAGDDDTAVM